MRSRVPWREAEDTDDIPTFSGDFFGEDYDPNEFPGFEEQVPGHADTEKDVDVNHSPNTSDSESSAESDDEDLASDHESHWEPPRPAAVDSSRADTTAATPDSDVSMNDVNATAANPLKNIQTYIDRFPGRAGEIIGPMPLTRDPAHVHYMNSVNGRSNPWAPFASEIDWEVAKWAKLRGPSSTAFSDLLAIPGVSTRFHHGLETLNTGSLRFLKL